MTTLYGRLYVGIFYVGIFVDFGGKSNFISQVVKRNCYFTSGVATNGNIYFVLLPVK